MHGIRIKKRENLLFTTVSKLNFGPTQPPNSIFYALINFIYYGDLFG
jgi:hypothetical protein